MRFGAVSAVVDGYAVQVLRATSSSMPTRIMVLVAAWLPGISDGSGQVQAAPLPAEQQALHQAGFRLAHSPAGIYLTASDEVADQMARDPQRMMELPTILTHAARITRAMGGVPVGALPQ
jgi:guanyl-specific ribonuclease Sa